MKANQILNQVLEKISPSKKELDEIKVFLKEFISEFEKKLKLMKVNAEVFVGGSFAKNTLIKKGQYDIDLFLRFDKKYEKDDISSITKKILQKTKWAKMASKIHGSRDYFKVDIVPSFFIEIIPVLKINKPKEAANITDLSYFHVNYIRRKLKTEKILEDVKLAKAFCHAHNCYGAESYINGFSGYALELLVYHYKGFLNFLKAMTKIEDQKIIDIEKQYKNKYEVEMNMNSAKMKSPIILIDPTYKERNALAALSEKTFKKFKKACNEFIKKPTTGAFETKKIDLEKIKKNAIKRKLDFVLIQTQTDKQKGDVAGSKLEKFYRHLKDEINKFYSISNSGFEYNETKIANYFFVVKKREKIILNGPEIKDKKNVMMFKKKHKKSFVKKGRLYAEEKVKKNIKEYIEQWKSKNNRKMKEMHITELKII